MFETYSNASSQKFDFEWPSPSVVKTITSVKQLKLKEIRYQQDPLGILTAIKLVSHDASSSFFSSSLDKKVPPIVMSTNSFYDNKDGHYRCNNIVARIEFSNMISNIYFNQDKTGIQRIGTKRGNGSLSPVYMEVGEQVIGAYGNYLDVSDRTIISGLGFIVWKPNAADSE